METLAGLGPLPAQPTVHLDRGYDSGKTRTTLAERGLDGYISHKGTPAPIQASKRWPLERTHAWGNAFGKLRWCTERRRRVVEFYLALAHAIIIVRRLVRRALTCYRWQAQAGARHRPGCQRCCSDAAWMRCGLRQRPWLSLSRSTTRPSFSATRWDGRLRGSMMAISRSAPSTSRA